MTLYVTYIDKMTQLDLAIQRRTRKKGWMQTFLFNRKKKL